MTQESELEVSGTNFTRTLNAAAGLPGVRIERSEYLRTAFRRYCSEEQLEDVVQLGPARAGISPEIITKVADSAITYESAKVTALSAAAGLPGSVALVATIPADVVQYFAHVLRIAQKLAYVYSWPDLLGKRESGMDDETESIMTVFVGVMFGVQAAQVGVSKAAAMFGAQLAKELPRRGLTKGVVYPIAKAVAARLGTRMTVQSFAQGAAKIVPVLGAAISGGLTIVTFLPMAKRLKRHLAGLELTKPGLREANDVPAVEMMPEDN